MQLSGFSGSGVCSASQEISGVLCKLTVHRHIRNKLPLSLTAGVISAA
jgi:hypothetical protein